MLPYIASEKSSLMQGYQLQQQRKLLGSNTNLPPLGDEIDSKPEEEQYTLCSMNFISLCFVYFCVKLVMYGMLFWIPFYLHTELGYSYVSLISGHACLTLRQTDSGYISLAYDVGGFTGSIVIGFLSDRIFRERIYLLCGCTLLSSICISMFISLGRYSFLLFYSYLLNQNLIV
jgi:sugar phosphate permease